MKPDISTRIIYEDNHLVAINKLSGELVQGDETGDAPVGEYIKEYLKHKYNKPGAVFLGVIHRLDRPVTGLVLFARTSKGLERMNEQFKTREVTKTYWAIVLKRPPSDSGKLIHFLTKDEKRNISKAHKKEVPNSKKAELDYKLLASMDGYHLLEVKPHTGRPHQIRVQLSSMGCPIAGDLKYGAPKPNEDASICLHARFLEFTHPVNKEKIRIEARQPARGLWTLFQ